MSKHRLCSVKVLQFVVALLVLIRTTLCSAAVPDWKRCGTRSPQGGGGLLDGSLQVEEPDWACADFGGLGEGLRRLVYARESLGCGRLPGDSSLARCVDARLLPCKPVGLLLHHVKALGPGKSATMSFETLVGEEGERQVCSSGGGARQGRPFLTLSLLLVTPSVLQVFTLPRILWRSSAQRVPRVGLDARRCTSLPPAISWLSWI